MGRSSSKVFCWKPKLTFCPNTNQETILLSVGSRKIALRWKANQTIGIWWTEIHEMVFWRKTNQQVVFWTSTNQDVIVLRMIKQQTTAFTETKYKSHRNQVRIPVLCQTVNKDMKSRLIVMQSPEFCGKKDGTVAVLYLMKRTSAKLPSMAHVRVIP